MRHLGLILLLAAVVLASVAATAGATVSGTFKVAGNTITPTHVVALRTTSTAFWDRGERIVTLVFSTTEISTEGIDQALDREGVIRDQIKGDYVIISLHQDDELMVNAFIEDGAMNYGFGGGTSDIKKATADQIAGRVFTKGEESIGDTPIAFDLTFDTAILPDRPSGTALEKGGGEPGAAYLAYVAALRAGDFDAILKHCPAGRAAYLARIDEDYRSYEIDSMKDDAPKEMQVTGGELYDGFAFLTVAGKDADDDAVDGQVKMVKDGGQWRFAVEDLHIVR
jgi:hypothetical protein